MFDMLGCCCAEAEKDVGVVPVHAQEYSTEKYPSSQDITLPEPRNNESTLVHTELMMNGEGTLGILLDNADDERGPMIREVAESGGAVALHNSCCSERCRIEVYDRIESVNGSPCVAAKAEEQLRQATEGPKLDLVLRKPAKTRVSIDKASGKPLGINMTYRKGYVGVAIRGIDEHGLIKDWNETHPEALLSPGDRILGMGDEEIESVELIPEMKRLMRYDLIVARY
eukprot:TRINITY_DN59594_c0_g1_i1.p1 TRINITY_DN59594_c0_g1~~TRINITY_DN59594_c0_g1_i1.p1  ORF type:complete len:227 (-),score=29.27 TRINITY_DN59594_c0_g1_i1:73-753(-)